MNSEALYLTVLGLNGVQRAGMVDARGGRKPPLIPSSIVDSILKPFASKFEATLQHVLKIAVRSTSQLLAL
jgi:hypothetical protein